jgi:parallel beta-helix repeat protein
VGAGTVTPVTITIGMNVNAGPGITGTLKYKVSYPDADVDHNYGTETLTVHDAAGIAVGGPENITNGAWGTLALAPGIYFVEVFIADTTQRTGVARTSVAHIYGGRETSLEFNIARGEFTTLVPLTITVDLTVPGDVTVAGWSVKVYADEYCVDPPLKQIPAEDLPGPVTLWISSAYTDVYARLEITIGANSYKEIPKKIAVIPGGSNAIEMAYRTTRYVRAAGDGKGTSWDDASGDVQKMMDELAALAAANPGYPGSYIVKLGAGTYKPAWQPMIPAAGDPYAYNEPGDPRDKAFILREGVKVWGGYPAAGGDDAGRNITAYPTVLSGDFSGNDVPVMDGDGCLTAINNATENAYHVVLAVDIPAGGGTVLDGLAIKGGNADSLGSLTVGSGISRFCGGGVYATNSSFAMTGGTISGNQALQAGGGALVDGTFTMTGGIISGNIAGTTVNGYGGGVCVDGTFIMKGTASVSGNIAVYNGGGVYVGGSGSFIMEETASVSGNIAKGDGTTGGDGGGVYVEGGAFTMSGGTISGNTASGNGGGIYNDSSSPVLTNVTISGNSATGVYSNGGGIYNHSSSPVLTNAAIFGNTAVGLGGGIANFAGSSPILTNVTIAGNAATDPSNGEGGGMANSQSSPQVRNSIIWGNTAHSGPGVSIASSSAPAFAHSIVQGSFTSNIWSGSAGIELSGYTGTNKDEDPLFVTPGAAAPTTGGNYSLQTGSPAIGRGDNGFYPDIDDPIFGGITDSDVRTAISAALLKDLDGTARIKGTIIDMGAYEK